MYREVYRKEMSEFCFTLRFATYDEFQQFHGDFAKFIEWNEKRAATRVGDRRGKHVAAIHARAKELCTADTALTYRMAFRLAACRIAEEEDAATV